MVHNADGVQPGGDPGLGAVVNPIQAEFESLVVEKEALEVASWTKVLEEASAKDLEVERLPSKMVEIGFHKAELDAGRRSSGGTKGDVWFGDFSSRLVYVSRHGVARKQVAKNRTRLSSTRVV